MIRPVRPHPKGKRRGRRTLALTLVAAMVASVLVVITAALAAPAASAQTCQDGLFPWRSQTEMITTCVRNFVTNPGVGELLKPNKTTGPDGLLTPDRVRFYVDKGFSRNFLWYAPEHKITTHENDTRLWTACEKGSRPPVGTICSVDDGNEIIQGPMGPDFIGSNVTLDVIGDNVHFISLACGNYSVGVGDRPVPIPKIRVTKFHDNNGNGVQDPGEARTAGQVFRVGRASSLVGQESGVLGEFPTDANGQFTFDLLEHGPGTYYVEEFDVPTGYDALPSSYQTIDVPFRAEDRTFDVTFGNAPQPPVVTVQDHELFEGETIVIDSAEASSPAGLDLTYAWSPDDKLDDGSLLQPAFTGLDDAVDGLTITVTDTYGQTASAVSTVTTRNLPPVPDIGGDVELNENELFTRTGLTYTDPGVLDTHTGTVDYGDGSGPAPLVLTQNGDGTGTFDLSHRYLDDDPTGTPQDTYTVTVTITDDDGGVGQDTLVVTVNNLDPEVDVGAGEVIDEGDTLQRTVSFSDIGTLDTHTVSVDFGEGDGFQPVSIVPGTNTVELSHLYVDDDPTATPQDDYTVVVRVEDDDVGAVEDSFVVTVRDVAPDLEITSPSFDGELFAAPATIDLVAPFTDPGARDTFVCSIDWDEGPATLDPPEPETVFDAPFDGASGNCDATNVFERAGVYTIRVTVTDDDTLFDVEERMIVVYDPSAGFVTGGGYIDSPAGAYLPDVSLAGKATFGFVSKYTRQAEVPQGNTEFQFHAGDLNFHSGDYEWLVVTANGTRAQYKGTGTINGAGDYGFLMTVYDNGEPGSGVDQLRMKIWDRATDQLIYDNRVGSSDDVDRADPQIITQGNIAIHTQGRNN